MTQKMEDRTARWFSTACAAAIEKNKPEILPEHLYYSILTDSEFCRDFWNDHGELKGEIARILNYKLLEIGKAGSVKEEKTKPALSEPLIQVISMANQAKFSGEVAMAPELLFKTLMQYHPIFVGRIQNALENYAEKKLALRFDKNRDMAEIKTELNYEFFMSYSATPASSRLASPDLEAPSISGSLSSLIPQLGPKLGSEIFGQDEVIAEVLEILTVSAAGFERVNKTAGSFHFHGPTGVGKTQLARVLADYLNIPFIKYDMSEYKENHRVSQLLGAPPGYKDHEKGGKLVEQVSNTPCAVLLLDEIEKAHSDIYDLLLQVMDSGELTDGRGVTANFNNIILIMTSNVGERDARRPSIGFKSAVTETKKEKTAIAVKSLFTPEFRNRLDADINFNDVSAEVMPKVVMKFVSRFGKELEAREIKSEFTEAAQAHLSRLGQNTEFGPRDVIRLIEKKIKMPVANRILSGSLPAGSNIHVDYDEEKHDLTLAYQIPQGSMALHHPR